MNYIKVKNTLLKASAISLASLFSFSVLAAEGDAADVAPAAGGVAGGNDHWGSPLSMYSNVNLGSGSKGIDISATFGTYLGGVYQHKLEVAVKEDLEYYQINYLLLNNASNSGVTIDTSFSEDVDFSNGLGNKFYNDVDSVKIGLFSKLDFPEPRFNAYPKMSVGYIWGGDIDSTTHIQFEVTVRFFLSEKVWAGATPAYIRSMDGEEIDEFKGTIDGGIKLSETFGMSASINEDKEFLGRVIFAF